MRARLDVDPELAWRALDHLELALMVCERATGRLVLVNERGARLLRSLGTGIDRLPPMLMPLLDGGDAELDAAGIRFAVTGLDDDELMLLTARPVATTPLADYGLSVREREIAALAGRGLSNGEIAN